MTSTATQRRLGLSVLVTGGGSGAQIVAAGELDGETVPALAEALADTAGRARRVVLDLTAVTLLDAVAFAGVCAALAAHRGQVALIPPA